MARRSGRPQPDQTIELPAETRICPTCAGPLWAAYTTQRSVTTLDGTIQLWLQVRRCRAPRCPRRAVPLRPESEGRFALPEHEFGLDVIALIGTLRHAQHRSVPEIHAELTRRGVPLCLRTVSNLLDRYDELLALSLCDTERLRRVTGTAGRVILAIDGLQPDVGHEVLWVLRDCLSGEVLLARSLLSSTQDELARLITEVKEALGVSIVGERRSSGRKVASPGLVVRGSVRLPAALATRLRGEIRGDDLIPSDLGAWRQLRTALERRQAVRAQGRRFRRDPAAYLQQLEDTFIKETLPP
jgi:hypothetical protein